MGNDSREYLRNRPLYEDSKIDTRYIFLRMILKREELAIKNKKNRDENVAEKSGFTLLHRKEKKRKRKRNISISIL